MRLKDYSKVHDEQIKYSTYLQFPLYLLKAILDMENSKVHQYLQSYA